MVGPGHVFFGASSGCFPFVSGTEYILSSVKTDLTLHIEEPKRDVSSVFVV